MVLTSAEHQQAHAASKRRRNAAARARRAASPHLVRVQLRDGAILLAAQSRSALGTAYELTPLPGGGWRCECLGFQFRGTCAHIEAMGMGMGMGMDAPMGKETAP